jgi:hypothetical protein
VSALGDPFYITVAWGGAGRPQQDPAPVEQLAGIRRDHDAGALPALILRKTTANG